MLTSIFLYDHPSLSAVAVVSRLHTSKHSILPSHSTTAYDYLYADVDDVDYVGPAQTLVAYRHYVGHSYKFRAYIGDNCNFVAYSIYIGPMVPNKSLQYLRRI
jgi:hypothetical protein